MLEFVQTLLATVDGFHWFAAGFGNMITLNDPYISAFDSPFLDSIISLVVQLFFAYRIWVLTRLYFLTGVVALVRIHLSVICEYAVIIGSKVSMAGSGGGMAVGIQVCQGILLIRQSHIYPRVILAEIFHTYPSTLLQKALSSLLTSTN